MKPFLRSGTVTARQWQPPLHTLSPPNTVWVSEKVGLSIALSQMHPNTALSGQTHTTSVQKQGLVTKVAHLRHLWPRTHLPMPEGSCEEHVSSGTGAKSLAQSCVSGRQQNPAHTDPVLAAVLLQSQHQFGHQHQQVLFVNSVSKSGARAGNLTVRKPTTHTNPIARVFPGLAETSPCRTGLQPPRRRMTARVRLGHTTSASS